MSKELVANYLGVSVESIQKVSEVTTRPSCLNVVYSTSDGKKKSRMVSKYKAGIIDKSETEHELDATAEENTMLQAKIRQLERDIQILRQEASQYRTKLVQEQEAHRAEIGVREDYRAKLDTAIQQLIQQATFCEEMVKAKQALEQQILEAITKENQ